MTDAFAADHGLALLALVVLAVGVVVLAGLSLPARPRGRPGPPMALDQILPEYQFGEHHEIRIAAPPDRVYAAVRAVTAREIRFFRLLTWLRAPRLSGRGKESVLDPAPDEPILDVATRSGFVLLRDDPPGELVVGTIIPHRSRPGPASAAEFLAHEGSFVRAVMNFHAERDGDGATSLVTQTRVHATDTAAERRFAVYWRLIHPGSAFIRRMWLRAVKARAEAPARGSTGPGSGHDRGQASRRALRRPSTAPPDRGGRARRRPGTKPPP